MALVAVSLLLNREAKASKFRRAVVFNNVGFQQAFVPVNVQRVRVRNFPLLGRQRIVVRNQVAFAPVVQRVRFAAPVFVQPAPVVIPRAPIVIQRPVAAVGVHVAPQAVILQQQACPSSVFFNY
jgi:hypothetical protein